jgi:hypothetical protein
VNNIDIDWIFLDRGGLSTGAAFSGCASAQREPVAGSPVDRAWPAN